MAKTPLFQSVMKLRRTPSTADVCALPLDAADMFLLTRVEGEMTVEELLDLAPCPPAEATERLARLLEAQLLEVVDLPLEERVAWNSNEAPELEDLVLDDADMALAYDDLEDILPYPSPESPDSSAASASGGDVWFEADPPSTLMSVFRRGPTHIEIQTVSAASAPSRDHHASRVVRKPELLDAPPEREAERSASKRK